MTGLQTWLAFGEVHQCKSGIYACVVQTIRSTRGAYAHLENLKVLIGKDSNGLDVGFAGGHILITAPSPSAIHEFSLRVQKSYNASGWGVRLSDFP